ncbi:hypothetical protein [Pontibacter sp. G13]|uniref:hypothetical protein n=1 Tax=Pontibacter sp. G13 TaxID=3074898 RepID=UPI00288C25D4|nr:hypothetical protein [Pontibacter sp. G13]WNJ20517.1 hypothetical protein RJD25_08545 [Pontibacter sp. G13]
MSELLDTIKGKIQFLKTQRVKTADPMIKFSIDSEIKDLQRQLEEAMEEAILGDAPDSDNSNLPPEGLLKEVRDFVAKGDNRRALERLETWARNSDESSTVIQLLGRQSLLEKESMQGILSPSQANRTQNTITHAILTLLDKIERN